jgi:hypothetical protein
MCSPVDAFFNKFLWGVRDKIIEPYMAEQSRAKPSGNGSSHKSKCRHAHPQGVTCSCSSGEGEWVKAEIDLMMECEVTRVIAARVELEALGGDALVFEPALDHMMLTIVGHSRDKHLRLRQGAK